VASYLRNLLGLIRLSVECLIGENNPKDVSWPNLIRQLKQSCYCRLSKFARVNLSAPLHALHAYTSSVHDPSIPCRPHYVKDRSVFKTRERIANNAIFFITYNTSIVPLLKWMPEMSKMQVYLFNIQVG